LFPSAVPGKLCLLPALRCSPCWTQPAQPVAEYESLDCRAAPAVADHAGRYIPGRVFGRDHRPSSQSCATES
jgi:hypothetical protein